MKRFCTRNALCAAVLSMFALSAQSELVPRLGGQAYYDTVLDITWLADANLAASNTFGVSGIHSWGGMTWDTAQSWLMAMNADGGTGYLGYNNWRLPTVTPVNGTSFNYDRSYNGTTDDAYNISAPDTAYAESGASELAYMYYNNLPRLGYIDPSSLYPAYTVQWLSPPTNTAPFSNLMSEPYWSGTTYGLNPNRAWVLNFYYGDQYSDNKVVDIFYAWAVRSGDITTVPLPGAVWLSAPGYWV